MILRSSRWASPSVRCFRICSLTRPQANIAPIAQALSNRFAQDVASIATILDPENPPSAQDLVPTVADLKGSQTNSEVELSASRLRLATEAAAVHILNRQATQQSIAILEQSIHGSVARGSKAKAEYLAIVAEGMSKKLSLQQSQLHSQLYSPEVREALRTKAEQLEARSRAVRRNVREGEEKLEVYRRSRGMEGVAREYAEVLAGSERVRGAIGRLEAGGQ